MARQGYDDSDNIERVEALLRAEPDLTRHAAIKRVVGANRSNIRRIETKMSRMAAQGRAAFPSVTPPAPVQAPSSGASEELRCLVVAVSLVLAAMALLLWPKVALYPAFVACWLQLKLATVLMGPLDSAGSAALATVEHHLSAGDFATMSQVALHGLKRDIAFACGTMLAAAMTATMAWSVWRLASLPSRRNTPGTRNAHIPQVGDASSSGAKLLRSLREPRVAMEAVVIIGGLAYMLPQLADFALVCVIGVTLHCIRADAPSEPSGA